MITKIALLIPTIEFNQRVQQLVAMYIPHFKNIFVALDSKQKTQAEFIKKTDKSVQFINFDCETGFVDSSIDQIHSQIESRWIFRLDDDELLSQELLNELENEENAIVDSGIKFFGIHRRWCLFQNGQVFAARELPRLKGDYQWRLYNKEKLTYNRKLHGPGFDLDSSQALFNHQSPIYHLAWILRSFRKRCDSLLKYDEIEPGHLRDHLHYYLWELDPYILSLIDANFDKNLNMYCQNLFSNGQLAISKFPSLQIAHQVQEAFMAQRTFGSIK